MTHSVPTRRSSDLPARLPGRELPLRPGGSPMKTLVAAVFIAFASLSAAHAVEVPRGAASDPRVKFVDYEEAQVYRIVGTFRTATQIVLSEDETIQHVALGDTVSRSEEHTSELQSLMRISYAVFCLKKKNNKQHHD